MDVYEKDFLIDAYKNISIAYAHIGQHKKALDFVEEGLKLANKNKKYFGNRRALESAIYVNEYLGNYKATLAYQKAYQVLSDSTLAEKKQRQVESLKILYENEKKERQIAELNQKNTEALYQIRNRNIIVGAIATLFILILLTGYILYQRQVVKKEQHINEVKQQLLRLQMNPHFLFNALSSIQTYILNKKDAPKAVFYLSKFAELMRQILEYSREPYITLEDEIRTLENYLNLQQLRYNKGFQYEIVVSETLNRWEIQVPPLIAQPFVENAIQHGKIHTVDNGYVKVEFTRKEDQLFIIIDDNGIGRENARTIQLNSRLLKEHQSLSTKITKDRLKLLSKLFQQKINLEIKDLAGQGTRVIFQLPLVIG